MDTTPPSTQSVDEAAHLADHRRVVLDDLGIRRSLMRIAHEIVERNQGCEDLYLVAIPNGGVPLGRLLAKNLDEVAGKTVPLGILDTTLYRDDLSVRGERPRLRETEMPSSVDGQVVVLVEDVVSTGRTIRAAMDALMEASKTASANNVKNQKANTTKGTLKAMKAMKVKPPVISRHVKRAIRFGNFGPEIMEACGL